jgi:N-acyl-D-amino-acid deacylase
MRYALLLAVAFLANAGDADLLIRSGKVVDGTGNPWFRADVLIDEGRVAWIGNCATDETRCRAVRTIDARGRVVAPGFIDVHTHIEGGIEKVARADNFLADGVTTVVTGNCGSSKVDLAAWFKQLSGNGIGINVASLIGHNSVRREAMGTANRAATAEELERMRALVAQGMRDGAVGFSTGLIYIPGTYAETAEVVALAKAASAAGDGVYASHMRDEGAKVLAAIAEACEVGKESGLRVQLSHFKIDNRRLWGSSVKSLGLVEEYRRKGVDVVVDQYPYDRASTGIGILLPSWALADGEEAIRERLSSPETVARISEWMKKNIEDLGQPDFSFVMIARFEPETKYEGRSIPEIAKLKGRDASVASQIETLLDLMRAGGAQMVEHSMGEADVDRIIQWPHTAVASDGGVREWNVGVPHPRSYGTNARVLAEYVRRLGLLTLEDAVRRMTGLPARTFGFKDRGVLREGAAADVVIFDPARVQDRATFTQPHAFSDGIDVVLVNGTVAVEDGKLTEARGGKIVRGAGYREAPSQ